MPIFGHFFKLFANPLHILDFLIYFSHFIHLFLFLNFVLSVTRILSWLNFHFFSFVFVGITVCFTKNTTNCILICNNHRNSTDWSSNHDFHHFFCIFSFLSILCYFFITWCTSEKNVGSLSIPVSAEFLSCLIISSKPFRMIIC